MFHIAGSAAISPAGIGYRPNAGLDPFPFDPVKARLDTTCLKPSPRTGSRWRPLPTSRTRIPRWWRRMERVGIGKPAPPYRRCGTLVAPTGNLPGIDLPVNVGEETAVKDKQYGGEIPGQYLVRSNEHSFDVGSKLVGRFADSAGAYISFRWSNRSSMLTGSNRRKTPHNLLCGIGTGARVTGTSLPDT